MSKIEKLEQLLKNDVLVEVNNEIKSIEKLISKQKNNDELKIELDYMVIYSVWNCISTCLVF